MDSTPQTQEQEVSSKYLSSGNHTQANYPPSTFLRVKFDEQHGILPNYDMGNAQRLPDGFLLSHLSGFYFAGWVKRGPAWVIATTITVTFNTTNTCDMGSQGQHARDCGRQA